MHSKIRNSSLAVLVLAAAAILSPPAPAAAAPCLNHDQAREKYPDEHLYWHTDAHCWDTSRRGIGHYEMRTPPDQNPVVEDVREGGRRVEPSTRGAAAPTTPVDQAAPGVHTVVYYPTLDVNAWPVTILPMRPLDMTTWPILLDVDEPTKFGAWNDRVQGAWRAP